MEFAHAVVVAEAFVLEPGAEVVDFVAVFVGRLRCGFVGVIWLLDEATLIAE